MTSTETAEEFERKQHYQMLKVSCLSAAALVHAPFGAENAEEAVEAMAKRFYRSITVKKWGSEPVEEPGDG